MVLASESVRLRFPRTLEAMLRLCAVLVLISVGPLSSGAQQPAAPASSPLPIGTVPTRDALVTGGLEVQGERARLVTNASVTAFDHTAAVTLARGGEVLVCSTSQFHLLHAGGGTALLFGLDRGAVEIHTAAEAQDVFLTPDIRFAVEAPGQFDLRVRVTREGDTCVENAGEKAPVLVLSDVFSSTSYRLLPRQHVLFEHGNLREVVDSERSSCGCPAAPVLTAQVPVVAAKPGEATLPAQAEALHPFPAAASNDLAPPPPVPNSPAGEKGTQIATTFEYGEGKGPPPSTVDVPASATSAAAAPAGGATTGGQPGGTVSGGPAEPPVTPPGAHDLAHAFGRFFHRLFHPRS